MIHVFVIAPGWELAHCPCIVSPFAPWRSITFLLYCTPNPKWVTLITLKNKPNFLWCKHSCMQINVYFLNWKTECEIISGQDANYRLVFLNFLSSFVFLLSAAETWDTKCLFSWLWVMASAHWCCHSDSWDYGPNNNIINSLSGIRRSAGDQRRTEKQRRRQDDGWTHANHGAESFPFLLPSSTLTSAPPLQASIPSI